MRIYADSNVLNCKSSSRPWKQWPAPVRTMVVFALTLIRHGETGHNKENVIQGQLDVPLSTVGIQQAKLLGQHLRNQRFTHVYSSDLTRAKQTAEKIVERNIANLGPIIHDSRLRERKFGEVEGKSFKFLKEAASKANKSVGCYTPSGAETVQQVRQRAITFFKDLCHLVLKQEKDGVTQQPSQNSCQREGRLISLNVKNVAKPAECGSRPQKEQVEDTASFHLFEGASVPGGKRKREGSTSETAKKLESSNISNGSHQIRSEHERVFCACKSSKSSIQLKGCHCKNACQNDVALSSTIGNDLGVLQKKDQILNSACDEKYRVAERHSCSISAATCQQMGVCEKKCSNQVSTTATDSTTAEEKPDSMCLIFADDIIRSCLTPCANDDSRCPNVSLSPLMEQCLTQVQSPLQVDQETKAPTRNSERRLSVCSSSDDADGSPSLVADILVVSHGGLLRELVSYFVEDLGCSVPGGQKQALRISPNAGLSKFTISFEGDEMQPRIICHQIHDKHHLTETVQSEAGYVNSTAL